MADSMLVGWLARRDGRPQNRAQHWHAAEQAPIGSVLSQAGEIGHFALGHQQVDDFRIHSVEAENHDATRSRAAAARLEQEDLKEKQQDERACGSGIAAASVQRPAAE
jgi:hypothetical protein